MPERERERESRIAAQGIPIGNLTSQLFANIYMNEFDQFMKHRLKVKYYIRYTDDFVIVSKNQDYLEKFLPQINEFLETKLALELHPKKIIIRKLHQGIDFLGHVIFPKYRLIRIKTKHRIFTKIRKRIKEYNLGYITKITLEQSLQSYLGALSHANTYELRERLLNEVWFSLRN
ncbi:MAG: RNA-directed DNA polymerase [Candidatus Harrisonbacteria bacterium]|nr:RNA-directed DNA polymerase [Candidatus Harrisonbacteria bacterium]